MGILGFKPKTDEVLHHSMAYAHGFSFSTQEFYAAVEKELTARKVPGLEISRLEYAEGGLLSERRTYLRLIRERLAFDICAAPFGTAYFFSCRVVYSPVQVKVWHVIALLAFFGLIFRVLTPPLGFTYAAIAVAALVLALFLTFHNAVALELYDLDSALLKTPIIGPIYERWFRKETYYREDTRWMYLKTVPEIVDDLAREITGDKGIKLSRYQRAPILAELYKPLPPRLDVPEKPE